MRDHILSLEYYIFEDEYYIEVRLDNKNSKRLLDEFYSDKWGKSVIDKDMEAFERSEFIGDDHFNKSKYKSKFEWFKFIIKKHFALYDSISDSSHFEGRVTHIPESMYRNLSGD